MNRSINICVACWWCYICSMSAFHLINAELLPITGAVKITLSSNNQCIQDSITLAPLNLRDSCQCHQCHHPSTLQRVVDDIDPTVYAKTVQCTQDMLHVEWMDGHITQLTSEWLATHIRSQRLCSQPPPLPPPPKLPQQQPWTKKWLAEHLDSITFDFDQVCNITSTTETWVNTLRRIGLTRLVNAKAAIGEIQKLSAAINAPLKRTVYDEQGISTFHVLSKPAANNQAYTAAALPLHTDLPFYSSPPDIQLLHCIQQSEIPLATTSTSTSTSTSAPASLPLDKDGASTFADGLQAANALSPEDQTRLLGRPVVFEDIDPVAARYHLEATHAVLEKDAEGNVSIQLNNGVRAAVLLKGDGEEGWKDVQEHYISRINLRNRLREEMFEHRAKPGDIWVFDNKRVLHGRREFRTATRELEGGYMNWDDILSLQRLLLKKKEEKHTTLKNTGTGIDIIKSKI